MKSEMWKRRKAAGLTLAELARASGVNHATTQALEAGRGKNFSLKFKTQIAAALGVKGGDEFFKLWPEERRRLAEMNKTLDAYVESGVWQILKEAPK